MQKEVEIAFERTHPANEARVHGDERLQRAVGADRGAAARGRPGVAAAAAGGGLATGRGGADRPKCQAAGVSGQGALGASIPRNIYPPSDTGNALSWND